MSAKSPAITLSILVAAAVASGCRQERPGVVDTDPVIAQSPDASAGLGSGFPTTNAAVSPPPITGGTVLIASTGHTAIIADPERDQVSIVDLDAPAITAQVMLHPGDEPGRLAEDGAGRAFVALRRGGAVATIDIASGAVLERRPACPAPRGVVYDAAGGALLVGCQGGELVTLPPKGGSSRIVLTDDDLRDLVIVDETLYVSRFRKAQILSMKIADTRIAGQVIVPQVGLISPDAGVAWRMVADVGGGAVVVTHEAASPSTMVDTRKMHAYGEPPSSGWPFACQGPPTTIIRNVFSRISKTGVVTSYDLAQAPLLVDVSAGSSGTFAVAAGNARSPYGMSPVILPGNPVAASAAPDGHGYSCVTPNYVSGVAGEVVALAVGPDGRLVYQTREPASVTIVASPISAPTKVVLPLSTQSRADGGHAMFHYAANGWIACASCHPEGGDDGRVWTFDFGARRTPSLRGTLAGTAPYHWDGNLTDIPSLTTEVLGHRMAGPALSSAENSLFEKWLFALPPPMPASAPDETSRASGEALFHDPRVGCATCHSGPKLTDNATVNVGTGGAFQVPSLVGMHARAPYLHNGCALTLRDRFAPSCGGAEHGNTSSLSEAQIGELVAYLRTL